MYVCRNNNIFPKNMHITDIMMEIPMLCTTDDTEKNKKLRGKRNQIKICNDFLYGNFQMLSNGKWKDGIEADLFQKNLMRYLGACKLATYW
jgi:hypothetical protein